MPMLELNDILMKFQTTKEKAVTIKSWNGDVKIRELTTAQRAEIIETMQGDSQIDEKGKGLKLANLTKAQILTAHYALVEPKMSIKELESLAESAYEGIKEICDEVEKLSKKKP